MDFPVDLNIREENFITISYSQNDINGIVTYVVVL